MIIYIVYILYSILWVFAYSMSDFNYVIYVLNINLKIWTEIDRPIKKRFYTCFKCYELETVLNYTKFVILYNTISTTARSSKHDIHNW